MNIVIKTMDFQQFCRVCFRPTSGLVSCFTKLVNEDISCTIVEILKLLSSEQNVS